MKIIVCVKQVPASDAISIDPDTHNLIRAKTGNMLNPSDLNALEAGLQLRDAVIETVADARVTALTMGPPEAEEALREAIATGADAGCILTDRAFAGSDTVATATTLAAGVAHLGPCDLILTGAESSDGATGQVGPMLAEALGLPHITNVHKIVCNEAGYLTIKKIHIQSEVTLRIKLPAVLSVGYGSNEPRLPTLRSKMAAKRQALTALTRAELGLSPDCVGAEGSPTEVTGSYRADHTGDCAWINGAAADVAKEILFLVRKEKESN